MPVEVNLSFADNFSAINFFLPFCFAAFVNRHLIKDRSVYSNSIPITPEQELDPSFRGRSCELPSAAEDPLRIKRTSRKSTFISFINLFFHLKSFLSESFYVNRAHVGYSDISCNNGVAHIMNDMF